MNLILFDSAELQASFSPSDQRMIHVIETLRMEVGDSFDMGIRNGPRGKAAIRAINKSGIDLDFKLTQEPTKLFPIHLICSYTRPAAAGRILREMTSIGISSMSFFCAKKAEKSYADSRIWKGGEFERFLVEGAEQAFCTRIPEVYLCDSLSEAIMKNEGHLGIALDNYESTTAIKETKRKNSFVFAIGPERGWDTSEREYFRENDFILADLGARVLRSDTAAIAAASILISKLLMT